jgi:hypothetical protein
MLSQSSPLKEPLSFAHEPSDDDTYVSGLKNMSAYLAHLGFPRSVSNLQKRNAEGTGPKIIGHDGQRAVTTRGLLRSWIRQEFTPRAVEEQADIKTEPVAQGKPHIEAASPYEAVQPEQNIPKLDPRSFDIALNSDRANFVRTVTPEFIYRAAGAAERRRFYDLATAEYAPGRQGVINTGRKTLADINEAISYRFHS